MIIDNRYEVVPKSERIGGQAIVYECVDLGNDLDEVIKKVAVKVTKLETSLAARSHERDVKSLRRLNHDNIIELLDWGAEDNKGFVVMPLLPHNLEEYLKVNPKLKPVEKIRNLIMPIVSALSYAHENGVAHRDLKPGNVLVDDYGSPLLTDFGAAKVYGPGESDLTQVLWKSGTYTPDITGTGFQHDVYSIGMLIIVIITGKYPKNHDEALDLLEIKASDGKTIFSDETKKLVVKCIALNPKDRYADAIALFADFLEREKLRQARKNEQEFFAWIRIDEPLTKKLISLQEGFPNLNVAINAQFQRGQELHIYPSKNDRDGSIKRNEYWLITDRLQLMLRPNSQSTGWNVVEVMIRDAQDLEKRRNHGFSLHKFGVKWGVHKNIPDTQKCAAGFKMITSEILDWLSNGAPIESGTLYEQQDIQYLAGKWQKLLDAREDVATINFKPIRYKDAKCEGLRIFLTLENLYGADEAEIELEGSFWKISFSRPELAEVVSQLGNEVELLLGREPKGKIKSSGQLIPEVEQGLASQLKRQRDAVNQVLNRLSHNPKLGDYLARLNEIEKVNPVVVKNWKESGLDDPKKEAVSKALGTHDFLLVKGPPGTGKTSFIAEYIFQEMKRDRNVKILLVSQTHVALDNALERLQKSEISDCVRLGLADDARISESSKKLLVDVQMREWMLQLRENSNKFIEAEAIKEGVNVEDARALLTVKEIIQIQNTIKQIVSEENDDENIAPEQENINQISLTNSEILMLKKKEEQRLVEQLAAQLAGRLTIPHDYSAVNFTDFEGALIGRQKLSSHFMDVVDTQAKWLDRVGSSRQLTPVFLQTRKVLAGTCIGFMSMPEVRDLNFDICIIDEASRATIPQALVSMVKAEKWIVVGDSNQLAPSEIELRSREAAGVLKEYEIEIEDTEESIFSFLEDSLPQSKQVTLKNQYRMRDEIGQMVSTLFYQNEISSYGPEIDKNVGMYLPAVEWSDTSNLSAKEKYEFRDNLSFSNRYEIYEIQRSLSALKSFFENNLLKNEMLPIKSGSRLKVLVIAPYSAQIIQAKTIIGNTSIYPFDVEFNSIDSVQGREADIVFFSCVRSNDRQELGFMGKKNWRRINVALSRARLKLHIVGDADFWNNTNSDLRDVVSYIRNQRTDQFLFRDISND